MNIPVATGDTPIVPIIKDGTYKNWIPSPFIRSVFLKNIFSRSERTRPEGTIPVIKLSGKNFSDSPSGGLVFWWLGHSSLIVEMGGYRFMIDPVLSESASPIPIVAKRFSDSPITIEDLPPIDFIILSHNHYDHMDKSVIKALAEKSVHFYVPTGAGRYLKGWGIGQELITETFWWEKTTFKELSLIAIPSRHFSQRSPFDRNKSLWCGWIVKSPSK